MKIVRNVLQVNEFSFCSMNSFVSRAATLKHAADVLLATDLFSCAVKCTAHEQLRAKAKLFYLSQI